MKQFEAKTRTVIAQYRVFKRENAELHAELAGKDEEIRKLKDLLAASRTDYNNLKLAKMIEISDSDIKESRMRISKLVRDINKCISVLSTGEGG